MELAVLENQYQCWAPTFNKDTFSNQLIDAYLNGKRVGIEQHQKLMLNKLEENIEKSGNITTLLLKTLQERSFNSIDAYLRVHSFDRFDIMITVPDEDYMKEEFLEMFDVISDIEMENREELYSVFIIFCSVDENFEEQLVFYDGFSLKLQYLYNTYKKVS
jgi:hypothetical protein